MRLDTRRLTIRPFKAEDIDSYSRVVSDPDVMIHLGGVQSKSQAANYVQKAIQSEQSLGFARYAVDLEETGELIGMCGFSLVKDYIDLGYRYAKPYWGQGFATEAAEAVINYGFDELGFPEIVATALVGNEGSFRVMEKLGFIFQFEEQTPDGFPSKRYLLRSPVAG